MKPRKKNRETVAGDKDTQTPSKRIKNSTVEEKKNPQKKGTWKEREIEKKSQNNDMQTKCKSLEYAIFYFIGFHFSFLFHFLLFSMAKTSAQENEQRRKSNHTS